jgi:hypothetical protein
MAMDERVFQNHASAGLTFRNLDFQMSPLVFYIYVSYQLLDSQYQIPSSPVGPEICTIQDRQIADCSGRRPPPDERNFSRGYDPNMVY